MKITDGTACIMTKAELRVLAAHASKDASKAHLSAVCFDFEYGWVASTDGHRLARVSHPGSCPLGGSQALLSLAALKDILKMTPKRGAVRFSPAGGVWTVEVFEEESATTRPKVTLSFPMVDAKFPPVEQVIPNYEGDRELTSAFGMNPTYLADLALLLECTQEGGVTFFPGPDCLDPILIKTELWTIVIMPFRTNRADAERDLRQLRARDAKRVSRVA